MDIWNHEIHFFAEYNTCRSKCNVKIYSPGWYMNSNTVYPLRRITVYFGDKLASENRCANSQYESQMLVNCSSWKHGKCNKQVVD